MDMRIAFILALGLAAVGTALPAYAAEGHSTRTTKDPSTAAIETSRSRASQDRRTNCTPYNGPFGYYGNPWCEGGYFWTEDRPLNWDGRYYRDR